MLDTTLREMMPGGPGRAGDLIRREVLARTKDGRVGARPAVIADDPFMDPDKSPAFRVLNAIIDSASAAAGAFNSDADNPIVELCEQAGVTLAEYEALAIHADGRSYEQVAKLQHVSEAAARSAARRGLHKLRSFISNTTQATFSPGLLEDLEGGDEA